jgi:hypothetical protein
MTANIAAVPQQGPSCMARRLIDRGLADTQ